LVTIDMTTERPSLVDASVWNGRFPFNPIISLLDVDRRHNLAESTSQNALLGQLLDLVDLDGLRALSLGYGSAQGLPALRESVGALTGMASDAVLTTQGTALGLFLLAFEAFRPDREAVLTTPCFPPARDTLAACGFRIREVRLSFDEGYRIDVDRVAEALSPATRLVSIATPQNPSGVATPLAEIR
jgi:DNA-binding transcriptional MocR family regulator